jgi:hypothetical protein
MLSICLIPLTRLTALILLAIAIRSELHSGAALGALENYLGGSPMNTEHAEKALKTCSTADARTCDRLMSNSDLT